MADKDTPADPGRGLITLTAFAALVERTPQMVRNEIRSGFIPQERPGVLEYVAAIRGHCKYLEDLAKRVSKRATDSEVARARAKEIEQKVAMRDRKLIAIDDAHAIVDFVLSTYRMEFDGFAARYTRDLHERRKLQAQIDAQNQRATDRLAKAMERLAAGLPLDGEAAAAAPGPVGGAKQSVSRVSRNPGGAGPDADSIRRPVRKSDRKRGA
jgi:hypothetical protein